MPETREMPRRRKTAGARTHDQHSTSGRWPFGRRRPTLLDCHVADEAFDGVDAYRSVDILPVAGILTWVVADTTVNGRKRIVSHDELPRFAVASRLCFAEP